MSLPFLIPEPFKEKWHGSCKWFLARSNDIERLMIVRTYRTCCFTEYNHSHCKVFEQDPSFSGPSGIFDWRLISSLGTRSLFVGLNYLINQEITVGKDLDGREALFLWKTVSTRRALGVREQTPLIVNDTACSQKKVRMTKASGLTLILGCLNYDRQ